MQITIRSKNIGVSESLRNLIERKLGRLERFFDDLSSVDVELSREPTKSQRDSNRIEVSLHSGRRLLARAEARDDDIRSALDSVADVLQVQIVRHKEKLKERGKVSAAKTVAAMTASESSSNLESDGDETPVIVTQPIEMKPQTVEEAADELIASGSPWLLFIDARTGQVCVLESQADGSVVHYEAVPV